ncbi:MAG: hypothetical protein ACREJV_04295 [Candidatus Rokuibacteriota bacterium]
MRRWLLRVAFLSFAGYPAAVVTSDYFAVSALVDDIGQDAVLDVYMARGEDHRRLTESVQSTIVRTAWLRRIGLQERALRVRLDGPVLRVALTWSCWVVRIGDRPLLAVPLSVERLFPFP